MPAARRRRSRSARACRRPDPRVQPRRRARRRWPRGRSMISSSAMPAVLIAATPAGRCASTPSGTSDPAYRHRPQAAMRLPAQREQIAAPGPAPMKCTVMLSSVSSMLHQSVIGRSARQPAKPPSGSARLTAMRRLPPPWRAAWRARHRPRRSRCWPRSARPAPARPDSGRPAPVRSSRQRTRRSAGSGPQAHPVRARPRFERHAERLGVGPDPVEAVGPGLDRHRAATVVATSIR